MADEIREYELVLMLDPGLEESAREELAQQARGRLEADGTIKHESNWGLRKMAYEIDQRTEADYRWYRFEAGRELLGSLDHNLKITDGVLRFRIFRVDPASPVGSPPPAVGAPAPARAGGERGRGPSRPDRDEQGEAPAPAAAPAEPAAAEPVATEPAAAEPAAEPAAPAAPEAPAEAEPAAEPAAEAAAEPAPEPAADPAE